MTTSDRIVSLFPACAGLLGACGIGVSAAAAHVAGGGPAATAGTFLLIHAAALLGLTGVAARGQTPRAAVAGLLVLAGTVLFAGELSLAGLLALRPLPLAAPTGGMILIAGWLVLPAWSLLDLIRGSRNRGP